MKRSINHRAIAFTLVELLVVIGIIALLIAILMPALSRAREQANRVKCAANLRSVGQAMHLYAHDNYGHYPRTKYAAGSSPRYFANSGIGPPFANIGDTPSDNDLTAAYFLLLHYKYVPVDVFVCPSTDHQKDPLNYASAPWLPAGDPTYRSNFTRTDPLGKDFSYSFTNPYPGSGDQGPLDTTYQYRPTDPSDLAIAADRNDGDRWRAFKPDVSGSIIQSMNSSNHRRKGQNVLFNDGSVVWHETPFCGRGGDNIWTRAGAPAGASHAYPAGKYDSVLLPMYAKNNRIEP